MGRPLRLWIALAAALLAVPAAGQDRGFRLEGLYPVGGRTSVTEAWGTLRFTVTNLDPTPHDLRVLVFYPEHPDVQYGRDVWVPANSQLTSWVTVGPAPAQEFGIGREIKYLVYDRTSGEAKQVHPDRITGDERTRNRAVAYKKREPTTAILLDDDPDKPGVIPPGSPADRGLLFARSFRQARNLSEPVTIITDHFLPGTPEAFDGTDQLIVAGNRLATNPPGARAVRQWVEHGGTLWVMLDLVDPATVAAILGDGRGFDEVGRTSLTSVRLRQSGYDVAGETAREFDDPVSFVRVALGGAETALYEVDGWPAAFVQPLGRGKIVVTTLGGEAWHRPRGPRDRPSLFEHFPDLPVALPPLERLATAIYPEPQTVSFQPADLAPLVTADIGYSVIGRETVALALGAAALGLLGVGLVVRRSRRPGLTGWLGPAAMIVAAGVLVALAAARREAVPPTTGAAVVLDVSPGNEEAAATGLFALYRPESGPVELVANDGGRLELDTAGLEGQTHRRVQTDLDAWHSEGLSLPAGVRTGPFRASVPTGPVRAVAMFGPDGITGRLTTGRFRDPADSVLLTQSNEAVVVRLAADGSFAGISSEALPPGQFMAEAVLTDRQQRRQDVLRKLLVKPAPRHLDGRDLLFVWAEPTESPFTAGAADRTVGTVLLTIPVEFERPAAGERVTIPSGFIPFTAMINGRPVRPVTEGTQSLGMRFRFRLPPSVLPLTVERATLRTKVRASSRKFAVVGYAGDQVVRLKQVESPIDPVRVDVTDPRLVTPDADGYLYLGVEIGERVGSASGDPTHVELDENWRIESMGLEVVGRAGR
jgi:hypothetical protein